ncbi:MAG TPA: hypothetical protein VE377_04370 [Candidatus Dormibacteraeota bacterium]|nr:hypothetical protein [Candidatus Dormibacteraeota bacterium]
MCFRPQPAKPITPDEILRRRPPTASALPIPAFPSSSPSLVSTIGPAPKRVLTIVSWNIQTFFETKAQANPYVNEIIKEILEFLQADVCLLLETRDDVSVILSAVEHKLANPTAFKPDESTEDDWDQQTLEQESIEHLKNVETLAAVPTTFLALATELTGKRYKPPAKVLLFGNPDKFFPQMLKPQSFTGTTYNGRWKTTYLDSATLKAYYTPYQKSTELRPDDLRTVLETAADEADVEFRLRHCDVCDEPLGKSMDCVRCVDFGPFSTALENLRQELNSVSFSLFGNVQLETYGIFVRPHNLDVSGQVIQMRHKAARVFRPGCQLLRYTPPPNTPWTLPQRLAHYKQNKRLPPTSPLTEVCKVLDLDLAIRNIKPADFALEVKLNALNVPTEVVLNREERMSLFARRPNLGFDVGLSLLELSGGIPGTGTDEQLTLVGVPTNRRLSLGERTQAFRQIFNVPISTTDQDVLVRIDHELQSKTIDPNLVVLEAAFDKIKVPKSPPTGDLLPYLDPSSNTYGRSPFVVPLRVTLSGDTTETVIPLVGFHAPYGEDNPQGLKMRADSLMQVLNADVGDGSAFQAHDSAILMGDFNLDLGAPDTQQRGEAAKDAYDRLRQAGFPHAIPKKVPSSLKTVFNNNWKKQQKLTKYDGASSLSGTGDVTAFTSSAYDNVVVKGAKLQSKVITAAVIDVIGWIKRGLQSKAIPEAGALKEWPNFADLDIDQKAFFIYRAFVSDHLPIVLDIEVEPLSPDYDLRLQPLTAKPKVQIIELTFSTCRWIDDCPATSEWHFESARCNFGIGRLTFLVPSIGFKLSNQASSTILQARHYVGSPALNQLAAVIEMKQTPEAPAYVHALVDCANPVERLVPIDPATRSVLLIGRVTRISKDGLRFQVTAGQCRCILNLPDNWSDAPAVGTYVLAILEGIVEKEVTVAAK